MYWPYVSLYVMAVGYDLRLLLFHIISSEYVVYTLCYMFQEPVPNVLVMMCLMSENM